MVVTGEVALLAKDPPGGHGGTAAGFEKFSLGEDLFSGEGLEQVAGSETCGSHEGLDGYGILITLVYEICYYYIILRAMKRSPFLDFPKGPSAKKTACFLTTLRGVRHVTG